MRQRTLYEEDRKHGSCDGRSNRYACSRNAPRQQKDICQRERSQQQHGNARYRRLPSTYREPESKVRRGKRRVSSVESGMRNDRVSVSEIICRRNVEAGFVPEERQSQKGSVQEKDGDKDDRVEVQRVESRRKLTSLLHPRC